MLVIQERDDDLRFDGVVVGMERRIYLEIYVEDKIYVTL